MFEGLDWAMVGQVFLWIGVGLALRTFGPYFIAAKNLVQETNKWRLPVFEPRYIIPPVTTLMVYIVTILTVQDSLVALAAMHPTVIVLAVAGGQDIIREAIRAIFKK